MRGAGLMGTLVAISALALGLGLGTGANAPAANRPKPVQAAPIPTRYSLVHGCYHVRMASGEELAPADAPYRMQATRLGQYLLYGVHGDYLGQGPAPVAAPSPATVWQVDGGAGKGSTITNLGDGTALPVSFAPAAGCAVYPEGGVDANGPTSTIRPRSRRRVVGSSGR